MSVPMLLSDWSYAVVTQLCKLGQVETDRHDFKAGLPHVDSLTKLCCAFANTRGGFIVLGVKERGGRWSPEGIDPDAEIAHKFGQKIRADPAIPFEAPLLLKIRRSSKVIYVFHVPLSGLRPHVPADADKRRFWKRTNTGCELMTLEEIRAQFLNYEERRTTLKLLCLELLQNKEELVEWNRLHEGSYREVLLETSVLDRALPDLYSLVQSDEQLAKDLLVLRREARLINSWISKVAAKFDPFDHHGSRQMATWIRNDIQGKTAYLLPLIDRVLATLETRFQIRV